MGNYLQTWTHTPSYPDSHRKYLYTSLENIDKDLETHDDVELDQCEEDTLPDLPPEVWSNIVGQLSFSDKVREPQVCKIC